MGTMSDQPATPTNGAERQLPAEVDGNSLARSAFRCPGASLWTPGPALLFPAAEEVVRLVIGGQTALYEVLMRRYNERIYRVARAMLRDDAEAEDVMQQAYVNAYTHLHQFERRARFGTWLTRIAVNEAFARLRRRGRFEEAEPMSESPADPLDRLPSGTPSR